MIGRKLGARATAIQTFVVCLVLTAFLGFAVASTLSAALRRYRPDIALAFRPADDVAKARLAGLIQERSGFNAEKGVDMQFAKDALLGDATVAVAARVIGTDHAARGDEAAAFRAMSYADALTRRD